jgi:hypothetical protein
VVQDVKPHRLQAARFENLPIHPLRDLAEDTQLRGQTAPPGILPDDTAVRVHDK